SIFRSQTEPLLVSAAGILIENPERTAESFLGPARPRPSFDLGGRILPSRLIHHHVRCGPAGERLGTGAHAPHTGGGTSGGGTPSTRAETRRQRGGTPCSGPKTPCPRAGTPCSGPRTTCPGPGAPRTGPGGHRTGPRGRRPGAGPPCSRSACTASCCRGTGAGHDFSCKAPARRRPGGRDDRAGRGSETRIPATL